MNYFKFTEHNDWEGESWNFYIPIEGNTIPIQDLKTFIKNFSFEDMYEIDDKPYTEEEVTILCDNTESGYMDFHNCLSGKLIVPFLKVEDCHIVDDPFYKGGIENLMEK